MQPWDGRQWPYQAAHHVQGNARADERAPAFACTARPGRIRCSKNVLPWRCRQCDCRADGPPRAGAHTVPGLKADAHLGGQPWRQLQVGGPGQGGGVQGFGHAPALPLRQAPGRTAFAAANGWGLMVIGMTGLGGSRPWQVILGYAVTRVTVWRKQVKGLGDHVCFMVEAGALHEGQHNANCAA